MKPHTIRALLLATIVALTLGISGCASTPHEEPEQQESSTRSKSPGSIMAPAPAHGSDDMERLD